MDQSRLLTSSPRTVVALCILLLTICFSHIHQGNLAIDGIRYAAMSQEVLASGNLFHIVDDYTGTEYANKSPALFWFVALSYRLFGVHTFSSKFPGACFAFLALFLLYRLASQIFGSRSGYFSVLLFAGNVIFFRAVVDLNYEAMILVGVLLLAK